MELYNKYGVPNREVQKLRDEVEELVKDKVVEFSKEHNLTPGEIRIITNELYFSFSVAMSEIVLRMGIDIRKKERSNGN